MSKPRDKLIQVEIYGQRYSLRGHDDPGYVERIARLVDSKMREIAQGTPTVDSLKVAVLAAVNIADELMQQLDTRDDVDRFIAEKTERISELLDETVRASGGTV